MTYTDENRGRIQSPAYRQKIVDYSGVRIGKITPSDIDGIVDVHAKGFIVTELKFVQDMDDSVELGTGQKRLAEAMIDGWERGGLKAYYLVCKHHEGSHDEIDAAGAIVEHVYCQGKWHTIPPRTLGGLYQELFKKIDAGV